MTFTDDEKAAIAAMVKNFKCPVCGNTHIDFEPEAYFEALHPGADATEVALWLKKAVGHCHWCGLLLEFDMDKLMASAALLKK